VKENVLHDRFNSKSSDNTIDILNILCIVSLSLVGEITSTYLPETIHTSMSHKAIIIAGGKGTRLWPLSRKNKPKQFQRLISDKSLIKETYLRLRNKFSAEEIFVSTNNEYVEDVMTEIPELPVSNIISEPEARGTASSIALTTALISKRYGSDTIMSFFPSDHYVKDTDSMIAAINEAEYFLKNNNDYIVTYGIIPQYPETGYGYIKSGNVIESGKKILHVDRFFEKPNYLTAQKYLEEGNFYWNSGMYTLSAQNLIRCIKEYIPNTYTQMQLVINSTTDEERDVVESIYNRMDKINIEYGVIENESKVAVIPMDIGWSDVGSWSSLKDTLVKENKDHFSKGEHIDFNSENLFVYGSQKLIVTVGIKNVVIIDTEDSILVCDKAHSAHMSDVVKKLEASNFTVT
jgi:mannose-1-phosphate guanylyltransferase